MPKILFWSNEKWRDEAPNRLVRRREPAGGHFIPSQMAAHDANSGSGPISRMEDGDEILYLCDRCRVLRELHALQGVRSTARWYVLSERLRYRRRITV